MYHNIHVRPNIQLYHRGYGSATPDSDVKQCIHKYSRGFGCAAWYADLHHSVQLYNTAYWYTEISLHVKWSAAERTCRYLCSKWRRPLCHAESLVRNGLMGQHCKRGGVIGRYAAVWLRAGLWILCTGCTVSRTICTRVHRALEHCINVYVTGYHCITDYRGLQL